MPIDWVALVAVVMGTLTILIPIAGFTLRFALKPVTEAVIAFRSSQGVGQEIELLEKRVSFLEQQNANLEEQIDRLTSAVEFHDRLAAPEE